MVKVQYRTPSGSGKYIGFGLRIETGAERTTIVDIFDIIEQVRDTGIHLKLDEDQIKWRTTRGSKRQAGGTGSLAHYLSGLRRPDAPHNKGKSICLSK